MLSIHSLNAARSLMPLLDNEKTTLVTLGDTPLHELVRMTSKVGTVPTDGSDLDDTIMSSDLQTIARGRNVMGVPEHDLTMDEITPIVAQAIGAALGIARHQVNPMIKRVVERVEKQLDEEGSVPETPINIVPQYHNRIWRNPVLSEMVSRYEETLQPSDQIRPMAIGKAEVDLEKALVTGLGDLDNDVKALYEGMGLSGLTELWDDYFASGDRSQSLNEQLHMLGVISPYRLIVLHLLALRFADEAPDTDGVSLDDWQGYVATLRAATGRLIARRITLLDRAIAAKKLVIQMPSEAMIRELTNHGNNVSVTVNHMVYTRWLEDGGSPEILLGSILSDQNTNYEGMIANADRYRKVWADHERMVRLTRRNKTFNSLQNYIGHAIGKEINDVDLETVPHTREEMHADLTVHVGHMCATDVENLYETVRHILCNTIFKHTDSLRILTEFDRLAKECPPESDMREVALMVAVNYASDWVAEMIQRN